MVAAVLFDLDGTLADTALDLARALNIVLQQRQLPCVDANALKAVAGHGARAMVNFACPQLVDGTKKEQIITDFLQEYEQNPCVDTVLFAGVNDFLATLQKKNIPWGIVTNKNTRFSEAVVAQLPWHHSPQVLVSGDTLTKSKPDPAPLLFAASQLAIAAQECVYIGDGLRDIQAAHAAGMISVAVTWGYVTKNEKISEWHADYCIDKMADFPALLLI